MSSDIQAVLQMWMRLCVALLAGPLLLAACAPGAGTSGASGSMPAAGSGTSTPQASGCPNAAATAHFVKAADVVLTLHDANQTSIIAQGQVVEIHLPDTTRWSLTGFGSGPLVLQQPAGFADLARHTCVWRFLAQADGSTTVSFSGRPICPPGQPCPQFILAVRFAIVVQ
jgi:hypothetical protein